MLSIELIKNNLLQSRSIVLSKIEDMREFCFVCPTPNGGCHTMWVLGHLAFIEALVIHKFMLGQNNPLIHWQEVFDGKRVSHDTELYPSFDEVLQACRDRREQTIKLLDPLTEDDLDSNSQSVPDGCNEMFGTYRQCFQYVADHWYMHRGQLADARRAAGIERMWF